MLDARWRRHAAPIAASGAHLSVQILFTWHSSPILYDAQQIQHKQVASRNRSAAAVACDMRNHEHSRPHQKTELFARVDVLMDGSSRSARWRQCVVSYAASHHDSSALQVHHPMQRRLERERSLPRPESDAYVSSLVTAEAS